VDPRKIVSLLMLTLMVSPSLAIVMGAEDLTVETDEAYYNPGEDVAIFGTAQANASVAIMVNDTYGSIFDLNVSAEADGEYSVNVTLSADAIESHYAVTASVENETAQASFTVISTSLQVHAENLLSLVEGSREEVESLIDELGAEDIEIPDGVNESVELGFTALEAALELLADGNYSGAIEEAPQALQHFGSALRLLQEVLPEETSSAGAETERALGLRVAIERAYEFIDKIEATADRLEEAGYEVPEIEAYLTEARAHLEAAEGLLDEDSEAAAQELAEARGILGRTMGLVHSMAKREVKAMKTERFLEQVNMSIHSLEEKIDRLQLRLANGQGALSALRNMEMKLLRITESLAAGDVEGAVDGLDDAVQEIDEEVEELNGREISRYLRAMNRLEAKIRVLNATAERLAARGVNASRVEEELQSAEALLSGMMAQLEEGDTDAAGDLLEEVEEHLKEIRRANLGKIRSMNAAKVGKWVENGETESPEADEED